MLATTIHKSNTTPHHQSGATTRRNPWRGINTTSGFPHSGRRGDGLVVSKPNSVSGSFITGDFPRRLEFMRGNMEVVEWEGHRIRRKRVRMPDGETRVKPEYEDVVAVARALGLAPEAVRAAVDRV
jgi:hypothetical protein